MAKVPPIKELEAICGGEGRSAGEPRNVRTFYARLVRKVSIRITWLILHTGLSANQVTVAGVLLGMAGAAALTQNNFWDFVGGIVLLQLSFVVDFSDGEVARYRGGTGAGGAFLDWIGHYYIPAATAAALGWSAFALSGQWWIVLAAFVLVLGLLRVAYSARDHVLLGLYRDRPEMRGSDEFVWAVLARQGGDPDAIDIEAGYLKRRSGASGRGFLWKRFTNLGQLLVYPGFVNLVSLALLVDLVLSAAGGHYPQITESIGRQVLIGVLGAVQLAHQLRAALQSFAILKRLR